jgi:zinc and cadmium transporter
MTLAYILSATFIVSLISLVGVIGLALSDRVLNKLVFLMVGFAAGSLIGAAFLDLLPEALKACKPNTVFAYTIIGFVFFFIMERYFYWRHCHDEGCEVHNFTYLNLFGDAVHNFTDGMIIAVAFLTGTGIGMVTTLAIIFHEIPHELGNFSIMVFGGFGKSKALFYNFLSALTAMLGAVVGYEMAGLVNNFSVFLLPFSAGGFIYIAASDLLPELHKEKDLKKANLSFAAFFLGLIFMWIMSRVGEYLHAH